MKEKSNNNIDDIFKSSIEHLETEPSEGFWIRASEDSLFKNNLAKRSELNRWKTTAYVLGAAIIALAIYLIYSQEELSGIKKQLTKFKEENAVVRANVKNSEPLAANYNAHGQQVTQSIEQPEIKSTNNIAVSRKVTGSTLKKNDLPGQYAKSGITQPITSTIISKATSSAGSADNMSISKVPVESQSAENMQGVGNNSETHINSDNDLSDKTDNNSLKVETNATENNKTVNISTSANDTNTVTPVTKALLITKADSTNNNLVSSTETVTKRNIWSRFSVSIFYAPYISDELFENESADNTTINNTTANEEEVNPYMLGARIGYDVSSRLSVVTGLYYYSYQVAISPITIYAQQQKSGDIGYSLQTSMGTVNCQYNGTPNVGDGMKVNGTATAHYISIPLQLKYNILNKGNFGLYVTTGAAINIVAYRKMDLHWEDFSWNEGDELEGIQNTDNVYFSFYASLGISYKFFKDFSLYLEPSVLGSPSFISQSGNSDHSSLFTGIGGGLTYHF